MTYWDQLTRMPILTTTGWWGIFTRGAMQNYTYITRAKAQPADDDSAPFAPMRIIVGPWYHANAAFMDGLPNDLIHKRYFDWHLKADEDPYYRNYDIMDPSAPVLIYVMGREQWRREKEWPLSRVRHEALYLSGARQDADQNTSLNNGTLLWPWEKETPAAVSPGLPSTPIDYDPLQDPALFTGQTSLSSIRWIAGADVLAVYNGEQENEKHLLTFSTARLDQDVEITGPMVLRFYARSQFGPPCENPPDIWFSHGIENNIDSTPLIPWAQQTDVHWIINLHDVNPDGNVMNITSGWLAASHRPDPLRPDWTQEGYDPFDYPEDIHPAPPESGQVYEYVVEIWPASNLFKAGHQIRIDIALTDIPHLLPSLVPSENEILHDAEHPSRLIIPVVDPETTDPRQWIDDTDAFFAGDESTWVDW